MTVFVNGKIQPSNNKKKKDDETKTSSSRSASSSSNNSSSEKTSSSSRQTSNKVVNNSIAALSHVAVSKNPLNQSVRYKDAETAKSNIGNHYKQVVNSYNKYASGYNGTWGQKSTNGTSTQRQSLYRLINEVKTNRKNLGDSNADSMLNELNKIRDSYDGFYARDKIYSNYSSELDYNKARSGWLDSNYKNNDTSDRVRMRQQIRKDNDARLEEIKTQSRGLGYYSDQFKALQKEYENIQRENDLYDRNQKTNDDYVLLRDEDGFAANSHNKATGYNTDQKKYAFAYAADGSADIDDKLGAYIAGGKGSGYSKAVDEAQNPESGINFKWMQVMQEGAENHWDRLEEGEIETYYYLFNTQGKDAAYAYLDNMRETLTKKSIENFSDSYKDENDDALQTILKDVAMSALSVSSNGVGGAMAFADDAWNVLNGKAIDPYNSNHAILNYSSAIRGDVSNDINKATGNAALPYVGTTFGDVYQAAMSGADSVLGGLMFGSGYTTIMGLGAASSKARELYDKGANESQMIVGGLMSGAIEMITEYVSLDHFLNNNVATTAKKETIKKILAQAGVEGSEEMASEILNLIVDAANMGQYSDWNQMLTDANGSYLNALRTASAQVLNAGIGGFLSGGMMAGAGTGVQNTMYNMDMVNYGKELSANGGVDTYDAYAQKNGLGRAGEQLYAKAKEAIDAVNTSDRTSKLTRDQYMNIGKYADSVDRTTMESSTKDAIRSQLESKGMDTSDKMVDQVYKHYSSDADIQFGNKSAKELASELKESKEFKSDVLKRANDSRMGMATEKEVTTRRDIAKREFAEYDKKSWNKAKGSTVSVVEGDQRKTGLKIRKITDADNRMVELSDGTTTSIDNVYFSDSAVEEVYNSALSLGGSAEAANNLVQIVSDLSGSYTQSKMLAAAVVEGYNYGKIGYSREYINPKGLFATQLTPDQQEHAYSLGVRDANNAVSAAQQNVLSMNGTNIRHGKVTLPEGVEFSKLDPVRQASISMIGRITSDFTYNHVYIFESEKDENGRFVVKGNVGVLKAGQDAPNGEYRTNTGDIYIDLNSGQDGNGTMLYTFSHELTHMVSQWSPAKYKQLSEYLFNQYGKHGENLDDYVAAQIAKSKGRLSYEEALEEVVADSMQSLLTDSNLAQRLGEIKARDKSLWDKLKQFFVDIVNKIRDVYKDLNPDSQEGRFVKSILNENQRIVDLFADGIVDAGETYQRTAESEISPVYELEDIAEELPSDVDDVSNVTELVKNSYRSYAESIGFEARVDNYTGVRYFATSDGRIVKNITEDMIRDSALGAMIGYSNEMGYISDDQLNAQVKMFTDIANMCVKQNDFAQAMQFVGSSIFTGMKMNADKQYGTTYDFPSICTKTQAVIDAMSHEMVKKKHGLTKSEIEKLYRKVWEMGNPVPCPECYVFSRWVGIGGLLDNIQSYQEKYKSMTKDEVESEYQSMKALVEKFASDNDLSFGKAKGKLAQKWQKEYNKLGDIISKAAETGADSSAEQMKYALLASQYETVKAMTWIDTVYFSNASHTKVNRNFYVPASVLFDLNNGETFANQYKEAWAFRTTQGAGYGKAITPYAEAVLGEGILTTTGGTKFIKSKANRADTTSRMRNIFLDQKGNLNKEARSIMERARKKQLAQAFLGGQRLQSTSDARYENMLDYLIAAVEMQAMHSMAQVYTKVSGAVPAFNEWGFSGNMSLMPLNNGFNAKGEVADTPAGGMKSDVAFKLREDNPLIGTITIGVNDEHIRAMFRQRVRDFIIPYHASGGDQELISSFRRTQDKNLAKGKMTRSNDYSKVQGEKVLKDGALKAIGKTDAEISDIHKFRDQRLAILTGKGSIDTDYINKPGNEILRKLYSEFKVKGGKWYGAVVGKGKVSDQIYPNEYWDTSLTYDQSAKITRDYLDYCDRLGMLHKFSGIQVKYNNKTGQYQFLPVTGYDKNGNKTNLTDLAYIDGDQSKGVEPFFWKVLTDRRMYDNEGKYIDQHFVSLGDGRIDIATGFAKRNEGSLREYSKEKSDATIKELDNNVKLSTRVTTEYGKHTINTGEEVDTFDYLNSLTDDDVYFTYKSMTFWGYDADGNAMLRSPMAEKVDGKLSEAYLMPPDGSRNWYVSTEGDIGKHGYPNGLVVKIGNSYYDANDDRYYDKVVWDPNSEKSNAFFLLEKEDEITGTKSIVPARYNPYEHSSDVVLNDQFSSAYKRGKLVTVKMAVPKSESGAFRAKYSKDSTGWAEWKSGIVAGKIASQKEGFNRNVFLSRFAAPVEIIDEDTVASEYKKYLDGTDVRVPDNVVPPKLLAALEKAGVPIERTGLVDDLNAKTAEDKEYANRIRSSYLRWYEINQTIEKSSDGLRTIFDSKKKAYEKILSSIEKSNKALSAAKSDKARAKALNDIKEKTKKLESANIELNVAENNFKSAEDARRIAREDYENVVSERYREVKYSTRDADAIEYTDDVLIGTHYSGGGLLESGLIYKMLKSEFAVEWEENLAAIYKLNHGNKILVGKTEGDVFKFDGKQYKNKLFYFHASPVFHNFSPAKHGGVELEQDRASARKVVSDVADMMPVVFTAENGERYIKSDSCRIIVDGLRDLGYTVDARVYDSADYGSPTSRRRTIIRAIQNKYQLPDAPLKQPRTTTWDSVARKHFDGLTERPMAPSMLDALKNTPGIKDAYLGDNKWKVDVPTLVLATTNGHKVTYVKAGTQCPTLTTKCGDGRLILPDGKCYQVSPSLMGSIMGLPDDFNYGSRKSDAFTIIGNGIPTHLTSAVMGGLIANAYSQSSGGKVLYSSRAYEEEAYIDDDYEYDGKSSEYDSMVKLAEQGRLDEYKGDLKLSPAEAMVLIAKDSTARAKAENDKVQMLLSASYAASSDLESASAIQDFRSAWEDVTGDDIVDLVSITGFGGSVRSIGYFDSMFLTPMFSEIVRGYNSSNSYSKIDYGSDVYNRLKKLYDNARNAVSAEWKNLSPKESTKASNDSADRRDRMLEEYSIDAVKYSERFDSSFDKRTILSNALKAAAMNDVEWQKLQEYQKNIGKYNELQKDLAAMRAEMKDMMFTPGTRDAEWTARMNELRLNSKQTANRINWYDKQLLSLEAAEPLKEVVKREREKAYARAKEEGRQALRTYKEGRNATEYRRKIRRIVNDLSQRLKSPSETHYVPAGIAQSVIDVCLAIDPTGFKQDTKAAQKYRDMKQALSALRDAYDDLRNQDIEYQMDHDIDTSDSIKALADYLGHKTIRELDLDELEDVYNVVNEVYSTVITANKQIRDGEAITNYMVGKSIIRDMRDTASLRTGKFGDFMREWTLNPMRAVREMSGYNNNAQLVYLFDELNEGRRKADYFKMNITKRFDAMRSTEAGRKAFEDAVEKEFVVSYTDENGVKQKVGGMTKMQAMSMVLTWQREQSNPNRNHLSKPVHVPDFTLENKGKYAEAYDKGHDIQVSEPLVVAINKALSDWDIEYMNLAHDFFNVDSKNAVNEVSLKTKHRIIASEKDYIPYSVNQDYIRKESENVKVNASIDSAGILKSVVNNASQQLVMRGLNQVVDKHLDTVSKVYGLTIPVRNFNKAFNVSMRQGEEEQPEFRGASVKKTIRDVWGTGGVGLIDQAVADIQTGRRNDTVAAMNAIKSAFVASTLASNISVVIKQFASYPTAGYMLSRGSLNTGLMEFLGSRGRIDQLFQEIDDHTAQHWMRRQGLSMPEIGDANQTYGWQRKLNNKLGAASPLNWIQSVDVGTTAALWCASKAEAKRMGVKTTDENYWDVVTDLYNKVIEETQPMYDPLHRAEVTKNKALSNVIIFQTQPLQNSGILHEGAMAYKMAKSKYGDDSKQAVEAKKDFMRAVKSQVASHLLFTFMTLLASAMLHKMNPWRDKDKKLTKESVALNFTKKFAENMIGAILPIFGTYAVSAVENFIDGSTYDVISDPMVDKINTTLQNFNKLKEPTPTAFLNLTTDLATYFGIPATNLMNIGNSVRLYAIDIKNGEFGSFNAGVNYTSKQMEDLIYKAIVSGDTASVDRYKKKYDTDSKWKTQVRKTLADKDERIEQAAVAKLSNDLAEYKRIALEIKADGNFTQDDIVAAINRKMNELDVDDPNGEEKSEKAKGLFSRSDLDYAMANDRDLVDDVAQDLIDTKVANGTDADKASDSVQSSIRSSIYSLWQDGGLSDEEAQNLLVQYGGLTDEKAAQSLLSRIKSQVQDEVEDGIISVSEAVKRLKDSGLSEEDAQSKAQYWKFNAEFDADLSEHAVSVYYEEIQDKGISGTDFSAFWNGTKGIKGIDTNGDGKSDPYTKLDQIIAYIAKMNLTASQKDALLEYYGYSTTKYYNRCPWH